MIRSYILDEQRYLWPDVARRILDRSDKSNHLLRAVLYQRIGQDLRQEAEILAAIQENSSRETRCTAFELLSGLRFHQGLPSEARSLLECSLSLGLAEENFSILYLRRLQLGINTESEASTEDKRCSTLIELADFQLLLKHGNRESVVEVLRDWTDTLNTPEGLELRGLAHKALGEYDQAATILAQLLGRHPGSANAWVATLELNYLTRRSNSMALATASRRFPRDPGIATHRVLIELQQRQPGLARRSSFKERVLYSLGKRCPSRPQSDANLVYCYDHTGRCDLTQYLHQTLLDQLPQSPPLQTNVSMQMASLASPLYGSQAETMANNLPPREQNPKRHCSGSLRVGLISSDLYYHPVGRFVLMLLQGGWGKAGELHLINTGQPALARLQEMSGNRYQDLSGLTSEQRLAAIRSLELDVAMDLAGWTGGNNSDLFAAGLAPLQVNYLGYFASTGIPAMDVWLGDAALFPDPMQEWHSERIVRLPRPFLAWQPDPTLPEGRVDVPPAPSGAITFGCFNHVRKLSAPTLRLWAQLLQAIPGARLALKAFASDDPAVMALVNRRMRRCGLDPEAVIWLPTCPKPEDHLRQYGLIDIALDPFPNGGCTTTCEALWMGVPVITLCGSHYVSRMATAVLRGANLPEWVAANETEYLQLGLRAADQLAAIRSGRQQLRAHLQASPLGDAADLADHLWRCFEQLVQEQQPG